MDRLEHRLDGLSLTLGAQHLRLGGTLRLEDRGLPGAFGLQDSGLLRSLGGENLRATVTLGAHLLLHRVLDGERRVDGLQLDTSHPHAPLAGGLVEDDAQLPVDVVAAGEGFLEIEASNHVSQCCRGEQLDGTQVVRDLVRRGAGIRHLEVDDSVDRDDEVVLGDHGLRREGDDLLAHIDQRSHPVDERHQDVETRLKGLVILAESLDDTGPSLGDDLHRPKQDGQNEDRDDDDHDHQDDLAEQVGGHSAVPSAGTTIAVAPSIAVTTIRSPASTGRSVVDCERRAVHVSPLASFT